MIAAFTMTLESALPWALAIAGGLAVTYERIVGRGVWRTVAEGREQRVVDLESQVKRQEIELAELRGQINALYKVKTDDIVEGVVVGLRPFLAGDSA